MTRFSLSITDDIFIKLKNTVLKDECEFGAIVLCGRSQYRDPWTGVLEERFLIREVIEVPDEYFFDRSPIGMTWSTTPFYNALKIAEPRDYAVGVVHSHPLGPLQFSLADDLADKETFQIAFNRLESIRPHLSIIIDGSGDIIARAYGPDLKPNPVELIRTIGPRWHFTYPGKWESQLPPELDRQVRTFGKSSTQDLRQLRIGIVGCGGTGSAVASLLARVGSGKLALFDSDYVDHSNLNRLYFSKKSDANLRRPKVEVVAEGVAEIGLNTEIVRFPYTVDDIKCRDAVKACDILFGCTDDHLGRNFLNHLAFFYLIPVIDLGLLIEQNEFKTAYGTFDGRVTVVQPGSTCQICRRLIDPALMHSESLERSNHALFEHHRRAGYIPEAPDPSPVVITFTTELATMAVNELFQRLNGYRGPFGHCSERVRRFDEVKDSDLVPGGRPREGCPLCQTRRFDGRGDMNPFLNLVL